MCSTYILSDQKIRMRFVLCAGSVLLALTDVWVLNLLNAIFTGLGSIIAFLQGVSKSHPAFCKEFAMLIPFRLIEHW